MKNNRYILKNLFNPQFYSKYKMFVSNDYSKVFKETTPWKRQLKQSKREKEKGDKRKR